VTSRSVLVVSHHLDGFLRAKAAGLLHPATSLEVRRVSRCRPPALPKGADCRPRFSRRGSYPSKGSPRQQPYRITAAVALLPLNAYLLARTLDPTRGRGPACSRAPKCSLARGARPGRDRARVSVISEETAARLELSGGRSRRSGEPSSEEVGLPTLACCRGSRSRLTGAPRCAGGGEGPLLPCDDGSIRRSESPQHRSQQLVTEVTLYCGAGASTGEPVGCAALTPRAPSEDVAALPSRSCSTPKCGQGTGGSGVT